MERLIRIFKVVIIIVLTVAAILLCGCLRYELFYYDCKQENCIYYFINKKDSTLNKVDTIGAYEYGGKRIKR